MPATEISDLLPLPSGVFQPHPYQVFGLIGGEQDSKKIAAAIKSTIQSLQGAKESTDPVLWKRAAKLAKGAREVLLDPVKKKELDARFGIIDFGSVAPPPGLAPVAPPPGSVPPPPGIAAKLDPLAGLLPPSNPMSAGAMPAPIPPQAPSMPAPPSYVSAYVPAIPVAESIPQSSLAEAPVAIRKKTPARRRRSHAGMFMLLGSLVAIGAMVGGFVWFVVMKPGTIAISKSDEGFTITTGTKVASNDTANGAVVGEPPKRRVVDPIMGEVPEQPAISTNPSDQSAMENSFAMDDPESVRPSAMENPVEMMQPDMMQPEAPMPDPVPPEPTPPSPEPTPPTPEPTPPAPTTPETPATPAPAPPTAPEMSPEMIAEAAALITQAETAVVSRDWSQMKLVAEKSQLAKLTEEQRPHGESLFEISDLATFYRGAIQRGLRTLKAGSDFELTPDFRVIVVEVGPDMLKVQFNRTDKTMTIDEFSPTLADKLASFALEPSDPTAIAAQAVYQTLAPRSTQTHSADALRVLESMTLEGANPKMIAETLRKLLQK